MPNPSTFLDFADLHLAKDECYIDLYYRMLYHTGQHLIKAGTMVAGKQIANDEDLTNSHRNMIALNWLCALDSNLIQIVKLEKHKELKDGQQLFTMVNDVAKNINEWMKRHGNNPQTLSQELVQVETNVRNVRFEGYSSLPRGAGRGQSRGSYNGNSRVFNNRSQNRTFNSNQQYAGPRKFCPGFHYLVQEQHLDVNFRHLPAEFTR